MSPSQRATFGRRAARPPALGVVERPSARSIAACSPAQRARRAPRVGRLAQHQAPAPQALVVTVMAVSSTQDLREHRQRPAARAPLGRSQLFRDRAIARPCRRGVAVAHFSPIGAARARESGEGAAQQGQHFDERVLGEAASQSVERAPEPVLVQQQSALPRRKPFDPGGGLGRADWPARAPGRPGARSSSASPMRRFQQEAARQPRTSAMDRVALGERRAVRLEPSARRSARSSRPTALVHAAPIALAASRRRVVVERGTGRGQADERRARTGRR